MPNEEITKESPLRKIATKPPMLAPFIIEQLGTCVNFQNNIYMFNGKYYEEQTKEMIGRYIYNFYLRNEIEDKWTISRGNELISIIKYSPQIPVIEEFDAYENFINVSNGVLDLDSLILSPHSPDFYFTYSLSVDYAPEQIEAPVFTKFVRGAFAYSGNWEEGYDYDINTVENIMRLGGYLLYPQIKKAGIFFFLGEGANGKSLMTEVFRLFFDKKFISSLSLKVIADERSFFRTPLITSRINICPEAKGEVIDSEEIKRVSSGEPICIQRKFADPLDIRPRAKLVIASNSIPYFSDTSHGTYRRLFIFNFKNRFVSESEYCAEYDTASRLIFKRVPEAELLEGFKQERSAIFNLFLAGLHRMREDDWEFINSRNFQDILEEYKEGSDTLGAWLTKNYQYKAVQKEYLQDIYDDFRNYYYTNFGDKKFNYSTSSVARRIKGMFRVLSADEWHRDKQTGKAYNKLYYELQKINPNEPNFGESELVKSLQTEFDEETELSPSYSGGLLNNPEGSEQNQETLPFGIKD